MTTEKLIQLAAAACGAIGTVLLYFGTFGYEAAAVYADEGFLRKMAKRNKRRQALQRAGLSFLLLSFLLGRTSLFFVN